jgi:hypothetical protein
MEINPIMDHASNHLKIFEIKSDFCQGFALYNQTFLFMDNNKMVTKLQRMKESRMLYETGELNLKEKDSPNFVQDQYIANIILNENYTIYKSKVFYLFD